jgi:hypothetical protein
LESEAVWIEGSFKDASNLRGSILFEFSRTLNHVPQVTIRVIKNGVNTIVCSYRADGFLAWHDFTTLAIAAVNVPYWCAQPIEVEPNPWHPALNPSVLYATQYGGFFIRSSARAGLCQFALIIYNDELPSIHTLSTEFGQAQRFGQALSKLLNRWGDWTEPQS